jgi:hypothetical protein
MQNAKNKDLTPKLHMDCLENKLDAVAADLSAHRQDTEAHPTIYKVKEGI